MIMNYLIEITVSDRDAKLAAEIYKDQNFRECGIAPIYTNSYIGPEQEIEDFISELETAGASDPIESQNVVDEDH